MDLPVTPPVAPMPARPARELPRDGLVYVDGELVVLGPHGTDFPALMARLHPSAARVERLRAQSPAAYVAFDALHVTTATEDPDVAAAWLERFRGAGLDGVMAKRTDLPCRPGARDDQGQARAHRRLPGAHALDARVRGTLGERDVSHDPVP